MADKAPLSSEVRPGQVQYVAPQPLQAEAVYIHSINTMKHEEYKGKLSIIFGIVLIVLQTILIAVNIGGAYAQGDRSGQNFFLNGNLLFIMFPTIWTGIFVYISAGFAIGAGKVMSRGLIIAHLVLACIASVFAFVCLAIAVGALIYDAERDPITDGDKASLSLSVVWVVLSLVVFILIVWCASLCCQVLCCGRIKEVSSVEMITPINSPTETVLYSDKELDRTPK